MNVATSSSERPARSKADRREAKWGLLFISPWIIGMLAFTLGPMVATLVFSFINLDLAQDRPVDFVGLENYQTIISDSRTWDALLVTLKYGLIALPVMLAVPIGLALLVNSKNLKLPSLFRSLFFMPYIIPLVAAVLAWQEMLNPESGWLNSALRTVGISNPPSWLHDTTWVYPGLVIVGIWAVGFGFLVNLAGLRSVPTELYDAAEMDGAGWWARFRHVTLPMISPVLFYTLVLATVEVFQYFLVPLVLNDGTGDPGGATLFFNLHIYKTFFTFQKMSIGSALAWFLFLIILLVTLLLFRTSRRWVYYAAEER